MSIPLQYVRDVTGAPSTGTLPSDYIVGVTLAANTEQHYTVLAGARTSNFYAKFSFGDNEVYIGINATAIVPTGTIGAVTAARNPSGFRVKAGDVISLISPTTPGGTIEFFDLI